MWPWQKRSPFEELVEQLGLPKKVFISHSYKDVETRERLLNLLPKGIEPFVFQPIKVPPEQMVSDKLLDAIRACNGLIYLQGGASDQSFWVALERDYALRQGKPVFAFDATTNNLSFDTSSPIDPKIYISSSRHDAAEAHHIVEMLRAHYFDVWFDTSMIAGDSLLSMSARAITQRIHAGGYVVVLWSAGARKSQWVRAEIDFSDTVARNRVLFAQLDSTEKVMSAWAAQNAVQLFDDKDRSFAQRLDDLIVRLYWLIYRNTRQNQLS